jgi:multiple sugar transport system permease protein
MKPARQSWHAALTADFRHPVRRWGYVFMLPGILYFAIFMAWPIASTLWLSFTEWRGFQTSAGWIGLDNYKVIFTQDAEFGSSLGNTFYYVALVVPLSILLPLVLALLFDNEFPLKDFFRTVYFLPSITSMVAIGMMWTWAYEPLFGIFNGLLKAAHLKPLAYLKDTVQAMPAVAVVGIWSVIGYNLVILRAGLTAIPAEYYEAATIDGASIPQRILGITLPLLMPTITFLIVTSMINNLQVFTQVYVMTHGGPGNSTRVVAYHMYETGFSYFWFGKASAMAVVLFAIIMAITLIQMKILQRGEQ